MKKLILAIYLLGMPYFAMNAHAALFDDTEARKKIVEVETAMKSQNQASQAEIAGLKASQQALEQRLNAVQSQTLAEMLNQIELLKQENARLKGDLELANHTLDNTQQRQKDLYNDTDSRLRKLEGATGATLEGGVDNVSASPEKNSQEFQLLELANGLSAEGQYKEAFNAYNKFLKDYPNSALSPDAKYGLGYTQFALKNYKSAIATQQKVLDLHPQSAKAPDAMFNMANSQIQLGQLAAAKKTLRDLIAQYPSSDVIPNAQKRLKVLDSVK